MILDHVTLDSSAKKSHIDTVNGFTSPTAENESGK